MQLRGFFFQWSVVTWLPHVDVLRNHPDRPHGAGHPLGGLQREEVRAVAAVEEGGNSPGLVVELGSHVVDRVEALSRHTRAKRLGKFSAPTMKKQENARKLQCPKRLKMQKLHQYALKYTENEQKWSKMHKKAKRST